LEVLRQCASVYRLAPYDVGVVTPEDANKPNSSIIERLKDFAAHAFVVEGWIGNWGFWILDFGFWIENPPTSPLRLSYRSAR